MKTSRTGKRLAVSVGASALVVLVSAGAAQAQTVTVTVNAPIDVNAPVTVNAPIDVAQQQTQEQANLVVEVHPFFLSDVHRASSAKSLPKTGLGTDVGAMANAGAGSLLIGLALADYARRRLTRRVQLATPTAPLYQPPKPAEEPPAAFSEGDLLFPYRN